MDIVRELDWKEKQKVIVRKRGKGLVIVEPRKLMILGIVPDAHIQLTTEYETRNNQK